MKLRRPIAGQSGVNGLPGSVNQHQLDPKRVEQCHIVDQCRVPRRLQRAVAQIQHKGAPTMCLDIGTRVAKPGNVMRCVGHGICWY